MTLPPRLLPALLFLLLQAAQASAAAMPGGGGRPLFDDLLRLRALIFGSNGAFESVAASASWHQMNNEYPLAVRQWQRARTIAEKTMNEVRDIIGFLR